MIGMSCTEFAKEDFEDTWRKVSKEFSHWEIFSEGKQMIASVKDMFLRDRDLYDMTYSLHTAIADTNAGAVNDILRKATFDEFYSEMQCARDMDLQTVTIHPGIVNLACTGLRERSVECARHTMKSLDRASADLGVKVVIENMPKMPIMLGETAEELAHIVEGTDLSICFDIGHANTTGQIEAMIDTFSDRIANVHIHDNMGERDEHLTLGEGSIDFQHVISMLKGYTGNYIIESKNLDSAVRSKKVLERLL